MSEAPERVLCVAAHPDDECLLAGATLAKHVEAGDALSILVLADGCAARCGSNAEKIRERHLMLRQACKILGTEDVWIKQYPDNQMDRIPLLDIVQDIEIHLERFKPTILYTHWHGDLNIDHQITSRAVMTACRPLPGSDVKRILMGEVPSASEWGEHQSFKPTWFEDVTATMEKKLGALTSYTTEIAQYPHPRSIEGVRSLAQVRGTACGALMAEAFVVARSIG